MLLTSPAEPASNRKPACLALAIGAYIAALPTLDEAETAALRRSAAVPHDPSRAGFDQAGEDGR